MTEIRKNPNRWIWRTGLVLGTLSSLWAQTSLAAWGDRPGWAQASASPAETQDAAPRRASAIRIRESRTHRITPFSPESNNVSVAVGQIFLMGDLGTYSDAIGGELHYSYGVSEMFAFNTRLGFSTHSDGQYSQTTFLTGLRANLAWIDKVIPYAALGLGFYKPRVRLEDTSAVSPVLFGMHLGPGVDLQLTDNLFFGSALTFHDIFGTDKKLASGKTLSIGGTYTTFLIHAGVTF